MSTPPPPDPDAPLTGAARSVNRQGLIIIVWICFTIATLFVSLRLFVRWHQNRRFLADDYWITWALVQPFPVIRRCWYGVSVCAASALIVCIICSVLTCSPPSNYFHGSCDSPREQWRQSFNVIFSTTVDVATDLMIMALPIAVLPSLQLDKKKKIGLGIAFSLGIIIICVAIVRMSQVIVGKKVDLVGLAIWGAVETATALGLLTRGIKKYATSRSGRTDPADYDSRSSQRRRGHGSAMTPRAIVVSDCIPLDDLHRSRQVDGGIYVHKTFTTATTRDDSSSQGEGDEAAIVRAAPR
ncbi:hypothetical protein FOC1_g10007408 [Fusarium oxysporum f. sp. cubense race 1]|uniref:Rhodopsin domain-containing protein n=1 Tax=Fusarium oxysporum f. sp. cubense (strain race 1) TaxID=1229664 RepID=N4TT35_FUSC1|nr:hypothetical protein FOC1_g10007408 [Fusarium oxysporum f. sp. cubense race 1]